MEIGISHYNSTSFSSSLLDEIYHSIGQIDDEVLVQRESDGKRRNHGGGVDGRGAGRSVGEMANFPRACMIEKRMEKNPGERNAVGRGSEVDLLMKERRKLDRVTGSSTWISSDSGGVGGFFPRLNPVRTGASRLQKEDSIKSIRRGLDPSPMVGVGDGFLKTKSGVVKIYDDTKKLKQPISPGAKLAGFLNSLFSIAVKPKPSPYPKSTTTSTCSRSCLSKTPSSKGKKTSSDTGTKQSVRFSPADTNPLKPTLENKTHATTKRHSKFWFTATGKNNDSCNTIQTAIKKNRRVEIEEAARELLKTYQRKIKAPQVEDNDDEMSCTSSDLFELDNLSAIGMESYREELPVYETTRVDRPSRAAAAGSIQL